MFRDLVSAFVVSLRIQQISLLASLRQRPMLITKIFILRGQIMIAAVGVQKHHFWSRLESAFRTLFACLKSCVRLGVLLDLIERQNELVDFGNHGNLITLLFLVFGALSLATGALRIYIDKLTLL